MRCNYHDDFEYNQEGAYSIPFVGGEITPGAYSLPFVGGKIIGEGTYADMNGTF